MDHYYHTSLNLTLLDGHKLELGLTVSSLALECLNFNDGIK
ncbi:hypothetical protein ABIB18_002077 [Pantoea sp. UYEF8]